MTGAEAAYVPLLISAVTARLQYQGAQEEKSQRRTILNRSMQETSDTADKAAQEVSKEGAKFNPEQRAMDMKAAQDATYAQSQADLGGAGGDIVTAAGGNTSAAFNSAKAERAGSEGNRITALAQEMARVRAPGQLNTEEGLRRGALAGELSNMWSSRRNMNQASQLDAQGVESGLGTAGTLVGLAGQAYGAGQAPGAGQPNTNFVNSTANDSSLFVMPKATPSSASRISFRGGR